MPIVQVRVLVIVIMGGLATACRSIGNESLVMRVPGKPYIMGRADPTWTGRAVVTGDRLELEFPAIAPNNVGCGQVDTLGTTPRRRYYWLASASYPDSRYPNNHFQQVALDVSLPPSTVPTKARLERLLRNDSVDVLELAGEPPMIVNTVRPDSASVRLVPTLLKGEHAWRIQVTVLGAAVNAFLAAKDDTISLGWCQRDQWLTFIRVPLQDGNARDAVVRPRGARPWETPRRPPQSSGLASRRVPRRQTRQARFRVAPQR
jgi:hypothetical protein